MDPPGNPHTNSMFKEEPWKALVGSNKAVFYVHPGVLQHGISALAVRISGAWKDSSDKTLDWSDFDEETINCVLSYQYSGTYDLPGSSKDKEPTSQSTPSLQSTKPKSSHYLSPPSRLHKTSANPPPEPGHRNASLSMVINDEPPATEASPMPCQTDDENPPRYLLVHAKVYFAERYLLSDLAEFAARRMESYLKLYYKSPMDVPELVETIQLIYATTPPASVKTNDARAVLVKFVATHHKQFSKNYQIFDECDGSFMIELAQVLSQLLIQQDNDHFKRSVTRVSRVDM